MARKPVTSPEDLGQTDAAELPTIPEGEIDSDADDGDDAEIDSDADAVEGVEPEDDLVPMLSVAQSGIRPGTIVHIREIFIEEMVNKGEVTFLPEEE